jgi:hypothetical protein
VQVLACGTQGAEALLTEKRPHDEWAIGPSELVAFIDVKAAIPRAVAIILPQRVNLQCTLPIISRDLDRRFCEAVAKNTAEVCAVTCRRLSWVGHDLAHSVLKGLEDSSRLRLWRHHRRL